MRKSGMYGFFEHNILNNDDIGLCEQRVRFYDAAGGYIEITISDRDHNKIQLRSVGRGIGRIMIHPEASNTIHVGINDE